MAKNIAQPEVKMFTEVVNVGTVIGRHRMLTCSATGFNTSDVILNINKNHCVLTKEDRVETTGVQQYGDIYWRRDSVTIPQSEVSHYSCEVVHAASRFRVEKVWDPESDGGGRIISSEFIETNQPYVVVCARSSRPETNIFSCLASDFCPNNIIMNMKRNGRILTREDGVESSGVCSYGNGTFHREDYVEFLKSDKFDFSCEVIHDASGSQVETFWDHQLPPPPCDPQDKTGIITGAVVGVVVLVVVVSVVLVVLKRRGIRGPFVRRMISRFSGGAAAVEDSPPDSGNAAEAQSFLNGNDPANV